MKNLTLVIGVLAWLMLGAPASARERPQAQAATSASLAADDADPTKGRIVFFRPSRLMGAIYTYRIAEVGEDGKVSATSPRLGDLPNGGAFILKAEPGIHNYNITGPMAYNKADDRLRMEVEPGATYYVEQTVRIGPITGGFRLVPTDEARFIASKAKLSRGKATPAPTNAPQARAPQASASQAAPPREFAPEPQPAMPEAPQAPEQPRLPAPRSEAVRTAPAESLPSPQPQYLAPPSPEPYRVGAAMAPSPSGDPAHGLLGAPPAAPPLPPSPRSNTIEGRGYLVRNGETRTCAGQDVRLIPASEASSAFVARAFGRAQGGMLRTTVWSPQPFDGASILTPCDPAGRFAFHDLPDGDYVLATPVSWAAPSPMGGYTEQTGGTIITPVRLAGGGMVSITATWPSAAR